VVSIERIEGRTVEPIALIIQRTGNYTVHDTRERTRVATCVHELAVSSHCTLRRQDSRLFHAMAKGVSTGSRTRIPRDSEQFEVPRGALFMIVEHENEDQFEKQSSNRHEPGAEGYPGPLRLDPEKYRKYLAETGWPQHL
jgi:hypothetical protein